MRTLTQLAAGPVEPRVGALVDALVAHLLDTTAFLLLCLLVLGLTRSLLRPRTRARLASFALLKLLVPVALFDPVAQALGLWLPSSGSELRVPPEVSLSGPLGWVEASSATDSSALSLSLLGIWMLGAIVVLVSGVARHLLRHRQLQRTSGPASAHELEIVATAAARVGLPAAPPTRRSHLALTPLVSGLWRPQIFLPENGLEPLDLEQRFAVLAHECAHLLHQDHRWLLFERVLAALFWFHPLVWWLTRLAQLERERSCDEIAVGLSDQHTYLTAMTHYGLGHRTPLLGTTAFASTLRPRLEHIMTLPRRPLPQPRLRRTNVLVLAALLLFCAAAAIARLEPLPVAGSAAEEAASEPFSVRADAWHEADHVTVQVEVVERATNTTLSAAALSLGTDRRATSSSSNAGYEVAISVSPAQIDVPRAREQLEIVVSIRRGEEELHQAILPFVAIARARRDLIDAPVPQQFTGAPITLGLDNADLPMVLATFARLAGFELEVDPAVTGQVSVSWNNVPWDQALATLLAEHGLEAEHEEGRLTVRPALP